jgi:heme-degrading monooxygenase HmoA
MSVAKADTGSGTRSARPLQGRMTADAEGEVVVFLIGMRVNRLWALHRWLPVFTAMPRMLRELAGDKESGLLAHVLLTGSPRLYYVVQYWESKDKLYAYARDGDRLHRPAWTAFNRRAHQSGSAVGIWHETYVVPAGGYESIYSGMPPFGLGAAHGAVPVAMRGETGAERLAYAGPAGE